MKLTDYVADFLAKEGIKYVFGITGGGIVHFADSLDKNPKTYPIFNHHEQASALAAEAYARVRNDIGAAFVTTGPGGTNAITGVLAAWLDSVPCIYISGQARIEHTSRGKPVRQIGAQEFDILSLVSHITKYSVMVDDPKKIKYYLQKAAYIARSGRPGPVWIDLPLNLQWASVDPDALQGFDASEIKETILPDYSLDKLENRIIDLIKYAKRPIILAGYGIRLAGADKEFKNFIEKYKIPFVSSWNASDLIPTESNLYAGRIGNAGQRGGNLAIQNCDLLLAIGSHICMTIFGANPLAFARESKKIMVDIDPIELGNSTVKVDVPVQSDARTFLSRMLDKMGPGECLDINQWQKKCIKYKSYNAVPKEWKAQKKYVNPYVFIDTLSDKLSEGDVIVVDGGGTALYMSFQGLKIKKGQRLLVSSAIAAMGTGLPESIGACFANGKKRTICMTGDGSIQFNIQELQTIVHHKLPIKIFIFNNSGYLAIRHTQDGFLKSRYIGSCAEGGVSLPDFQKVARAYGIKAVRINNHKELNRKLQQILRCPGPAVCEIMISKDQQLIPSVGFDMKPDGTGVPRPLEDMYPYLDRKEFLENMIVKPL